METTERILSLLHSTDRDGMGNMINFLTNESDYFTAPASTKYHLSHVGGLAEHSLSVYDTLVKLNDMFDAEISEYKMITTALLHDICKCYIYFQESRWRKDDYGKWESYKVWAISDLVPLGHGEKSLHMISKYLDLDLEESLAVRWHMGAMTAGVSDNYAMSKSFDAAVDMYPLVLLLSTADLLSSRLVEERM